MKYSDILLVCDDREFKCHKFMLAKKSDVFDAMFSHNFAETHSGILIICYTVKSAYNDHLPIATTSLMSHQLILIGKLIYNGLPLDDRKVTTVFRRPLFRGDYNTIRLHWEIKERPLSSIVY